MVLIFILELEDIVVLNVSNKERRSAKWLLSFCLEVDRGVVYGGDMNTERGVGLGGNKLLFEFY